MIYKFFLYRTQIIKFQYNISSLIYLINILIKFKIIRY